MTAVRTRSRTDPAPRPDDGTRARLLESAARVIAERGFRGATTRAICDRAGANVAAINYHFGSKERLQAEALRWAAGRMPDDPWFAGATTGDERDDLRAAIRAFVRRILGDREEWHTRLMLRAMAEPNPGIDQVVRDVIEPRIVNLERVLRRFLPYAPDRTLRLMALGIVGQIGWFRVAGPVALRLLGERAMSAELADEVAAHVLASTEHVLRGAAAQWGPR